MAGASAVLSGMTIENGSVTGDGGGIQNAGTLDIVNCFLASNQATGPVTLAQVHSPILLRPEVRSTALAAPSNTGTLTISRDDAIRKHRDRRQGRKRSASVQAAAGEAFARAVESTTRAAMWPWSPAAFSSTSRRAATAITPGQVLADRVAAAAALEGAGWRHGTCRRQRQLRRGRRRRRL